jgi:hypothetical protein
MKSLGVRLLHDNMKYLVTFNTQINRYGISY